MCSELGYTHTHTQSVSLEQSQGLGDRGCVNCYLDPVQLFTQVCSWRVAPLNLPANGNRTNPSMISTLLDDTSLSSPFIRRVFVMWHALYSPLLYTQLLCGPCNHWALSCQPDSYHAAAVPQRATCVIRVEQRGPVRIDFIFFIFDRRTVVSISRCLGSI